MLKIDRPDNVEIVQFSAPKAFLFGDNEFAWHLRIHTDSPELISRAKEYDDVPDRIEFTKCIEQMLGESLPQPSKLRLYSNESGAEGLQWKFLLDPANKDIYVYAWQN